jgi:hypothetical protein
MHASGPQSPLQSRFEDGLRFLAAAYALREDRRNPAAGITSGCDALACFLGIFEAAAQRRLPDPDGRVAVLRAQCEGLLAPDQAEAAALDHVLEAAALARDLAASFLPALLAPEERG